MNEDSVVAEVVEVAGEANSVEAEDEAGGEVTTDRALVILVEHTEITSCCR